MMLLVKATILSAIDATVHNRNVDYISSGYITVVSEPLPNIFYKQHPIHAKEPEHQNTEGTVRRL